MTLLILTCSQEIPDGVDHVACLDRELGKIGALQRLDPRQRALDFRRFTIRGNSSVLIDVSTALIDGLAKRLEFRCAQSASFGVRPIPSADLHRFSQTGVLLQLVGQPLESLRHRQSSTADVQILPREGSEAGEAGDQRDLDGDECEELCGQRGCAGVGKQVDGALVDGCLPVMRSGRFSFAGMIGNSRMWEQAAQPQSRADCCPALV